MSNIIPLLGELVRADVVADCLDMGAEALVDDEEGLLSVRRDDVAGVLVDGVIGVANAVPAIDVQDHVAAKLLHFVSLCRIVRIHLFYGINEIIDRLVIIRYTRKLLADCIILSFDI